MLGSDVFGPGPSSLPPSEVRKLQDQQQRCINTVTEFKGQLGELYAQHASKLMRGYVEEGVPALSAVKTANIEAQKEIDHYEVSLKDLYKQNKDRESGQHDYTAIAEGVDELLLQAKEESRQLKAEKSAGRGIS
jgi:hypothetical protein